jgi:hypothetical protein
MKFHLLSAIVFMMFFNLITTLTFLYLEHIKKLDENGNFVRVTASLSGLVMLILWVMLIRRVIKSGWTI